MESLDEVALSSAVVRALKEAENRRDELGTNDPMRAVMEDFLAECTRRLSQPDLGERPKLPDQRRGFVGRSESDDRRPSRDAAYTAMEKLTEAAWPTKSNANKQVRKRQKQRHEALLQGQSSSSGSSGTRGGRLDVEMPLVSGALQPRPNPIPISDCSRARSVQLASQLHASPGSCSIIFCNKKIPSCSTFLC